jgi:phosphatidylinositol alpha-1,6-mannosyltransferase
VSDGDLRILRELQPLGDVDVTDRRFLAALKSQYRRIACEGAAARRMTLHVLRAFPEGISAALRRRLAGRRTRLVIYAHGEEVLVARSSRQLRAAARFAWRSADLVIANSANTARLVREEAPGVNVQVIHPGVDCARAQRAIRELATLRGITAGGASAPLQLATVARMEPRKNHEAVIRAVAALSAEGVALRYLCAGDGPERPRLQQLARELGIEALVRFPGAIDDTEKWRVFAACDVHVMPAIQVGSMIEGFGIVFMEAAAAGKPSICGRIGGQLEAVVDGSTGLAVDGGDPAQLATALRRLAADPALRARLGAAAQLRAALYDWHGVAARTLAATRAVWPADGA